MTDPQITKSPPRARARRLTRIDDAVDRLLLALHGGLRHDLALPPAVPAASRTASGVDDAVDALLVGLYNVCVLMCAIGCGQTAVVGARCRGQRPGQGQATAAGASIIPNRP